MSRFSKMPPRTSVPSGVTKGKPGSAPAASHNRTNKELQMSRITVEYLAQQQAATNAQMATLMSTVDKLVGIVAAVLPQTAVAVSVPVPAVPQIVAESVAVAAAAETAIDKRNAALARGRATAAANRAARKAGTTPTVAAPVAVVTPEPVAAPVAAAPVVPSVKVTPLTRARVNGTVVHSGTVGNALYTVAWNRTAGAWDWQFAAKGRAIVKGQVPNGDAARAVAFRALNAAAAKVGAAQVRAGK